MTAQAVESNVVSSKITVERYSGALGAVVSGVQLSPELDDQTIEDIKQALYKHKVLFFRDQGHLDDTTHQAFAHRMGPPYEMTSLPDEVIKAKSGMYELDGSKPGGRAESWHTDSTFSLTPPAISILRSVTVPQYGGDTTWANCTTAYAALHPALQELAEKLWVLHTNRIDLAADRPFVTQEELRHFEEVTTKKHVQSEHPLVHIHPHTGEKSLLVGNYAKRIMGVASLHSRRLLDIFQDHVSAVDNTVRWSWEPGQVAMWDNFATQHKVINDWGTQPRVMRRWTVAGGVPVSVNGEESRVVSLA
jgi:taurine dioxygenase